jgi:hypothetical protein
MCYECSLEHALHFGGLFAGQLAGRDLILNQIIGF